MIRTWLLALLALAAGSALAYHLRADSGYVLIQYRGWALETSVLVLFAAMVLGVPAALLGLRVLVALLRLPSTISGYRERRRSERARDSFEQGLLKLLEGHWQRAEIELVRRAADHHASHLNYLAAARAAQRMGAADRRDHYLELAARDAPQLAFATGLTQAELQRERGEYALAKLTALRLRETDPLHPYPVELLAECHYQLGEWAELHGLLLQTEKLRALPPLRQREYLLRAIGERMKLAIADTRLEGLKQLWTQAAPSLRRDPGLRRSYARGLALLNAHAEAAALIASVLNEDWDGELVKLYGELLSTDPVGHLASIEQWLNQYGEKPELLITAGRACLSNKLWGKARSYLEAVIRVQPGGAAAYLDLARLCEQTQNPDEAAKLYRQGLEIAARAG